MAGTIRRKSFSKSFYILMLEKELEFDRGKFILYI